MKMIISNLNKFILMVFVAMFTLQSFSVNVLTAWAQSSSSATFTTSVTTYGVDNTPPSIPANLLATPVSQNRIDLTWDASTDDYTVAGYRLFRDGSFLATTSSLFYSDSGLTASTTYAYTVESFDLSWNFSGQSGSVSTTTFAAPVIPVEPEATSTPGSNGTGNRLLVISDIEAKPETNKSILSWKTSLPTVSKVIWGTTKDYEAGSLSTLLFKSNHEVSISGLISGTTYFVKIEATNILGTKVFAEYSFKTLEPVRGQISNPSNFMAEAFSDHVALSWTNPNDDRFQNVRIVRSETFFPKDQFDGEPVYEGRGISFDDKNVVSGKTYYYAIFAKSNDGKYSSGALAIAYVPFEGEVVVPSKSKDPFANLPQSEIVHPMITALTLGDFEFIQGGRQLSVVGSTVAINGSQELTIRIKYEKVPEILKTIAVTLKDPKDSKKVFTFLLRIDADKSYYTSTIGALGRSGKYEMQVVVLDYKNQGMKRIQGNLQALAFASLGTSSSKIDPFGLILLSIALIILVFLALLAEKISHRRKQKAVSQSGSNTVTGGAKNIVAGTISTILVIVSLISIVPSKAYAAYNEQINYQGKIMTSGGSAVTNGTYSVRFKLYTTATGGSPIWTETWCNTSDCKGTGAGADNRIFVTNGLMSTMLGSTTSLAGIDFNQTLYLGVEIGGSAASTTWDGEMSPRKILGSVPSAFYSGTSTVALSANTLQNITPGQFFRNDVANSTSTSNTFLSVVQTGAGKIAEFFGASSQSVLSILSNGNIGVGTTSPFAKMSINANVGDTNRTIFQISSSTPTATTSLLTVLNDGTLNVGAGINAVAQITSQNSIATPIGIFTTIRERSAGSPLTFLNNGSTKYMVFADDGNLGIGTSSPFAKLSVHAYNGETNKTLFEISSSTASATTTLFRVSNTGDVYLAGSITGSSWSVTAAGAGSFNNSVNTAQLLFGSQGVYDYSGSNLRLGGISTAFRSMSIFTNAVARQTFDSFGNIGFGTTTPLAAVDVFGTFGSTTDIFSVSTSTASNTFSKLFNVSAAGNVGIGTSSPYAKLSVVGTVVASNFISTTTASSTFAGGVVAPCFSTDGINCLTSGSSLSGGVAGALTYWTSASTVGATTSPTLGYITATSTTGTSTFAGAVNVGGSSGLTVVANGKIGMGTTTPNVNQSLHIVRNSSAPNPFGILLQNTNSGGSGIQMLNSSLASANAFQFFLSDTSLFKIGQDNVGDYLSIRSGTTMTGTTGYVGINSNAPMYRLDVTGNARFTQSVDASYFTATSSSGNSTFAGKIGIGTTSPLAKLDILNTSGGTTPLFSIASSTNGAGTSTAFYVGANGNVGVGTSSPYAKFSVTGPMAISDVYITASGSNLGIGKGVDILESLNIKGSISLSAYADGSIYIPQASLNNDGNNLSIHAGDAGSSFENDYDGGSLFLYGGDRTSAGNYGNVVLGVTSSGNLRGNVGIGTTSPYAKLSVVGTVVADNFISTSTTASVFPYASTTALSASSLYATTFCLSSDCRSVWPSGGGTTGTWSTSTSQTSGILTNFPNNNTDVVSIGSNSTTTAKFWFDPNTLKSYFAGDVGIGTTNPVYGKLHIVSSNNINSLYMTNGADSSLAMMPVGGGQYRIKTDGSNRWISFADGYGASDTLVIRDSKVGIGTTSPFAKFSIDAKFGDTNTMLFQIASSSAIASSSIFAVLNNRNVGIGTADPTSILEIYVPGSGSSKTDALTIRKQDVSGGGGSYLLYSGQSGHVMSRIGGIEYTGWGGQLVFETNPTGGAADSVTVERMRIDAAGNVGIGTTSPYAKLSVVGTVVASNFVSTTTASSTFAGGIVAPCFSTDGVNCLTSGSSLSGGVAGALTYWTSANTVAATSSPTLGYITATSTNATSTFAGDMTVSGFTTLNKLNISGGMAEYGRPSLAFGDGDTGLLEQSDDNLWIGINGQYTWNFNSTSISANNNGYGFLIKKADCTIASPCYSFADDLDTGLSKITQGNNNSLSLVAGGAAVLNVVGGNVGIGTTSPFAKLSIHANNGETNSTLFNISSSTASATTSLFTVLNNGNVGIGTASTLSSPYKLDVVGNISTSNFIYTSGFASLGYNGSSIRLGTDSGVDSSVFAGSERIRIKAYSGYVGIGTTSPYAKLSVVGPVVAEYFTATSTTATSTFAGGLSVGSGGFEYDFTSGVTSIAALQTGPMNFETDAGVISWIDLPISAATLGLAQSYSASIGGTSVLTVYGESNGAGLSQNLRVGIGTTTPLATLTVSGSTTAATSNALLITDASSTPRFVVQDGGNVGIGTSSPYAKLSVVGQVVGSYFTATSSTASSFTYASTTALTIAGLASTTNMIVSNTLQLNNSYNGLLAATNGLVSATSTLSPIFGGTGISSTPTYGQLLVGNSNGSYTLTSTSSLGILASSAIGVGSTGQIAFYSIDGQAIAATSSIFIDPITGAVGMGTVSPTSKLSLFSSTSPQLSMGYDAANYLTFGMEDDGRTNLAIRGSVGGLMITNPKPATVGNGSGTNATTSFAVIGADGGDTNELNIGTGGNGGGLSFLGGNGGTADMVGFIGTGGIGGTISMTAGAGGASSASGVALARVGGAGGAFTLSAGAGGVANGTGGGSTSQGGDGGSFVLRGGVGGNALGGDANTGGNGGNVYLLGGTAGTGNTTNGNQGSVYLGYDGANSGNVYLGNQSAAFIGATGKLGIGTSSPFAKLSVHANNGETATTLFNISSSTASATTSIFTVLNNGNVGVGTTSSISKFSVYVPTDTTGLWIDAPAASIASVANFVLPLGNGISSGKAFSITATGETFARTTFGSNGSLGFGSGNSTRDVWIYRNAANSVAIDSNQSGGAANLTVSGNAGIGTTSPFAKLSVHANNGETNSTLFNISSSTASATTSIFTVLNKGNVGIGTDAPLSALQIINTKDNTTAAGLNLSTDSGKAASFRIGFNITSPAAMTALGNVGFIDAVRTNNPANGATYLSFGTNSGTNLAERIRISEVGNLGIGTSSPFAKLSISANNGDTNTTLFNISSSTASATTSIFTVLNNGNVGIGTASPDTKLQVRADAGGVNDFLSIKRGATDWRIWASDAYTTSPSLRIGGNVEGAYAWQFDWTGATANTFKSPNNSASQNIVQIKGYNSQAGAYLNLSSYSGTGDILTVTGSGNVGIGTTSPYAKLSVVGTIVADNFIATSTTATSTFAGGFVSTGQAIFDNLQMGSLSFEDDAGVVTFIDLPIVSAALGTAQKYSSSIDGNQVLTVYGESDGAGGAQNLRVGIGTTSPLAKLTVVGSTTAATSNALLVTDSTGATKFVVQDGGNVGVGTSSPYAKMSIQGTASSPTETLLAISSSTGSSLLSVSAAGYVSANRFNLANNRYLSNTWDAIGYNNSLTLFGNGSLTFTNYGTINTVSGNLTIAPVAGNTLFTSGNIGVGTTSPFAKLSIHANNGETNTALFDVSSSTASATTSLFTVYNNGNVGVGSNVFSKGGSNFIMSLAGNLNVNAYGNTAVVNLGNRASIGYNSSNTAYFGTNVDNGPILTGIALRSSDQIFTVNTSEKMRILDTGNIGIGTSSPFAKLSISANNGDTNTTLFNISSSTASATTSIFTVLNNGYVGIGTSSPFSLLSVGGQVAAANFLAYSTTSTSTFMGNFTVNNNSIWNDYATGITHIDSLETGSMSFDIDAGAVSWMDLPISFATSGTVESYTAHVGSTPVLTVYGESNGSGAAQNLRVGIGTTTPLATLTVSGSTTAATSNALLVTDSTGAPKFVVQDGGNVGIGTTSPWAKLGVSGSIDATQYFVGGSALAVSSSTLNNYYLFTGSTSPVYNTTAQANIGIGPLALSALTTPGSGVDGANTAVGYWAMASTTSGYWNSALGYSAGQKNTTGYGNTAVGYLALQTNTTGSQNTAIGAHAMSTGTGGVYNTAVGYNAGRALTSGQGNTAIGNTALYSNQSGSYNTVTGNQALGGGVTNVSNNSAYGYYALYGGGNSNSAFGFKSLYYNNGASSTAMGYQSGIGDGTTVDQRSRIDDGMTFIGYQASRSAEIASTTALTAGTAIGYNAQVGCSWCTVIGGTGANAVNVGIGTTTPFAKLSISANNGETATTLFNISSSTASATTSIFTVLNTGNIGVGTSSPFSKLSITGSGNTTGTAFAVADNTNKTNFAVLDNGTIKLNYSTKIGAGAGYSIGGPFAAAGELELYNGNSGDTTISNSAFDINLFPAAAVGIGTTTPTARLDVAGTLNSTRPLFQLSSVATGYATTSRLIVDSDGDVGVGTSTPTSRFEVYDSAANSATVMRNYTGGLKVSNVTTNAGDYAAIKLQTYFDDDGAYIKAINNGNNSAQLAFGVYSSGLGDQERMRIDNLGNVGIGTSSPTGLLSIASSALNNGTNSYGLYIDVDKVDSNNTSYGTYSVARDGSVAIGVYGAADRAGTANRTAYGVYGSAGTGGSSNSIFYGGYFDSVAESTVSGKTRALTANLNYTNATAGAYILDLQSNSVSKMLVNGLGNVGIGTTSPFAKLSVHANNGETNTALFNISSSTASATTSIFTVLNNGNVGIGTDAPSAALSVVGARNTIAGNAGGMLYVSPNTSNSDTEIILRSTRSSGYYWGIKSGSTNPTNNFTINDYGTSGATDLARFMIGTDGTVFAGGSIDRNTGRGATLVAGVSGRVGIGTTSPFAKLSIHANNGETNTALFDVSSSTASATTSLFTVYNNGNVGVGSNVFSKGGSNFIMSLAGNLNVNAYGNTAVVNLGNRASIGYNSSNTAYFGTNVDNGPILTGIALRSSDQIFTVNTSEKMRILDTGNIGIGTSSPFAKLSVVGNVVADSFSATSTTGTSTFAGSFNVGNGAIFYDANTGTTTIPYLETGNMSFAADSGVVGWIDMPVTSDSASGVVQSYTAGLNYNPMITVYGVSNGSGSVNNLGVGIGTTSPYSKFSVWGNGIGTGQLFSLVNNASSTVMQVLDNGNVGIGTTSPFSLLSVTRTTQQDGLLPMFTIASTTNSTLFTVLGNGNIAVGTSTSAVLGSTNIPTGSMLISNGALCVDDGAGNTCATSSRSRGFVYAEGSSLAGLDVAEQYETNDATLEPGDIVMADPENPRFVVRYDRSVATTTEGPAVLGVVSTAPGLVLGGFSDDSPLILKVPVALTGRVPVKVISSNGPIKIGDRISMSEVPGVGVKSNGIGATVGIALEAYDANSATSSILVFMDRQQGLPDLSNFALKTDLSTFTSISSSTSSIASINESITSLFNQNQVLMDRINALASSTASTSIVIDYDAVASSTVAKIASSTSMVAAIADAVQGVIQSAGNWIVDQFTARIAYVGRIEAGTVAISQGMEIKDQVTGSVWCVTIANGDWKKLQGTCAEVASSTPATTETSPIVIPVVEPNINNQNSTTDNGGTSTTTATTTVTTTDTASSTTDTNSVITDTNSGSTTDSNATTTDSGVNSGTTADSGTTSTPAPDTTNSGSTATDATNTGSGTTGSDAPAASSENTAVADPAPAPAP